MAAIHYAATITHVAKMLGEDEAVSEDISSKMDPEDGSSPEHWRWTGHHGIE